MKAKLLRDMETVADDDRVVNVSILRNGSMIDVPHFPAGTIIDDPKCYMLVRMGVAEPADDECADRASMTEEQMSIAQRRYEMVSKGIHPDDYERYEAGEIAGYKDGEDIPGVNAIHEEEESDDDIFIP